MANEIVRPFSHLCSPGLESVPPKLAIDLWDESEMECSHWEQEQLGKNFGLEGLNGGSQRLKVTVMLTDGRFVGHQHENVLIRYDRGSGHIIGSMAWNKPISIYDRIKPLSGELQEWYNDHDVQVIHAGLVARNDRGILVAGKGGSGKSTASLVCLIAGFDFLSEDYVGLQALPDGTFLGHSLYNSLFLAKSHVARFPNLAPFVTKGLASEKKSGIVLSQVFGNRLARVVPIRAVVLPRVVDISAPTIRPASKGEALFALGPSSLLQISNRGMGERGFEIFNRLVQLVARVPCYWLDLGRDLEKVPRCVEQVCATAGQA
jgi:hypothetical protein